MHLIKEVRKSATLHQAWFSIRDNARSSKSAKTKSEVREFEQALPLRIRSLQDKLRRGYEFQPSLGVLIPKPSGAGDRGLVVSPLPDRIVQRALLDVLHRHDSDTIQSIIECPTSFGGIPGRGVQDAIIEIERVRNADGAAWLAGSDISGFFTKIVVADVVDFVRDAVNDDDFTKLFEDALKVELANTSMMSPKDLELFPREGIGVAQGCPLSAFAGNIFLRNFDEVMNEGPITCLRYIDDFILLCSSETEARLAMTKAKRHWLSTRQRGRCDEFFPPTKLVEDKFISSILP
jgi:retron-type reverse transcriptase